MAFNISESANITAQKSKIKVKMEAK